MPTDRDRDRATTDGWADPSEVKEQIIPPSEAGASRSLSAAAAFRSIDALRAELAAHSSADTAAIAGLGLRLEQHRQHVDKRFDDLNATTSREMGRLAASYETLAKRIDPAVSAAIDQREITAAKKRSETRRAWFLTVVGGLFVVVASVVGAILTVRLSR